MTLKERAMKPVARQFLRTDMAQALTTVWGNQEAELAESVAELHDALETGREVEPVDAEARSAAIREAAGAIMSGDLQEHYLAEYTTIDNAERAVKYLGLDAEEWDRVRSGWVQDYRERGVEIEADRLVGEHIGRQFGVDRETFEELVVGWDDEQTQAAMREILLGPLDDVRTAIDAATETIEESES